MEITAVDPKEREYNMRLTATELADLTAIASQITGCSETSVRRTADKVYETVRRVLGLKGISEISVDSTFNHSTQPGFARMNIDNDEKYQELLARLR